MTRPRFAIFAAIAHYCDRDSIIGWSYRLEETATTYGWAAHRACALNDYDYDHGGDGCFELRILRSDGRGYDRCFEDPALIARRLAEGAAWRASLPKPENDDEIPF
jgi:hypothetical protein